MEIPTYIGLIKEVRMAIPSYGLKKSKDFCDAWFENSTSYNRVPVGEIQNLLHGFRAHLASVARTIPPVTFEENELVRMAVCCFMDSYLFTDTELRSKCETYVNWYRSIEVSE